MFHGSFTALATPMHEDGRVDDDALMRFVDWQITQGSHGLVAVGTTGESPTLTHAEHHHAVELAIKAANGRVPVMAGAGSSATATAIEFARHAEKAGADALLVVTPYYNKPTQEGLYQHYKAIAHATALPVFIYNIPGRCVVDMSVETMARLAEIRNIVGVKDATGILSRPLQTKRACGEAFVQLTGDDHTAVAFLASGGHGCISVTANVAPKLCAQMQAAWAQGDVKTAMAIQQSLLPLHDAMFCETSPGPVKYALSLLGFGANHVRLPLVPVSAPAANAIKTAMRELGLQA